jgi:Flp pilus assembly pilin Flp
MRNRFSLLLARAYTLSLEDLRREEGQTTVEYAIVVALVVAMAVAVFATLSTAVSGFMTSVGTSISNALPL